MQKPSAIAIRYSCQPIPTCSPKPFILTFKRKDRAAERTHIKGVEYLTHCESKKCHGRSVNTVGNLKVTQNVYKEPVGVSQSPRTGSTSRTLTAFRDPGCGSQALSPKPYLHWLCVSSHCRLLPVSLGPCRRMRPGAGHKLAYPVFNLPERDRPHFLSSGTKLRRSSDGPTSGQVPLDRAGM